MMIYKPFRRFFTNTAGKYKLIESHARLSFFLIMLCVSWQSSGAWLSICPDLPLTLLHDRGEGYLTHILDAQERITLLQITEKRPDNPVCEMRELPVTADKIAWAGFTGRTSGNPRQIALQGNERQGLFSVSEIIVNDTNEPVSAPAIVSSKQRPQGKTSRFSPIRASWFWSPASWLDTPQHIFDSQSALALKRIYITVPVAEGHVQHAEQLQQFLQTAHQRGLQVWAVLGDPQAVLEQERQRFLALVAAYQIFNADKPPQQRLDGLQLDIEPYLLPGYQLNPAIWLQKQAKIVNAVHQTAPSLPLDMALPFWFEPLNGNGAALLADVEVSIVSITVMNYRTDPEQIREFAEKFLAWGQQRQKAVYIALESLAMPEEDRRVYGQAESGELWRFDFKVAPVLLLLQQQAPDMPGEKAYRFAYSRKIDGSSTSFFRQPGALLSLLPTLETQFSAWSSFAGIALHGYEQP